MKQILLMVSVMMSLCASQAMAKCPEGTKTLNSSGSKVQCGLEGKYLSTQLILTSANEYILQGPVFIGDDNSKSSTLFIEPGTQIFGTSGSFISIMRGSKIIAEGTVAKPIIFTSAKITGKKRGDWGGLVINGNAPINVCNKPGTLCEAISEGITSQQVKYGGLQSNDNSGTLKYVRVEFGGYPVAPDNELNGISFNGVGSGTVVDYVQVHMNADDGVEFFGGTVNVKHLVLTANDDDSLDWDMGWVGKGQFILIKQAEDVGDNGFEADNLKSPMTALPRSFPELSNITMIGTARASYGMLLRRGTGAAISNAIVTGYGKACVDVDDQETFRFAKDENGIQITNTIFNCKKQLEVEADDVWALQSWFLAQTGNQLTDPELVGHLPSKTSPALGKGETPLDLFFDATDAIGAFDQSADWTKGWTTSVSN